MVQQAPANADAYEKVQWEASGGRFFHPDTPVSSGES